MPLPDGATPKVSVCIPVLNGAGRLENCLASLRAMDWPEDRLEIIIADGGSTDGSRRIAENFGARVIDNPGKTVAAGRNVSFEAATGEFIASTDDDCEVPRDWLRTALAAFGPGVGAVGGISELPGHAGAWAEAANWVFRMASRGGYSVQADLLGDGDVEDLPGCNVIYRAEAVQDVGAFDEGLVTAEDVDFHQRMNAAGWRLRVAPGLMVLHHKRPTAKGLFRQLRRYAEGRVQLGRKWPDALRLGHAALAWLGPVAWLAFALVLVAAPQVTLAAVAAGWVLMAFFAHMDGMSPRAAILTPLAAAVVATGWSVGYLRERFAPMPEACGR